jgi:hypothetical protein
MKVSLRLYVAFLLFLAVPLGQASLWLPATTADQLRAAAVVFSGTVVSVQAYEDPADGHIYTRTVVRVGETFKGKVPPRVKLVHRGGVLADRGEMEGSTPQFKVGEQRLLFVSRHATGGLCAAGGVAGALPLPSESANPAAPEFAHGLATLTELRARAVAGVLPGADVTDQAVSADLLSAPPANPGPLPGPPTSSATNLMTGADGIPHRFILPDRNEPIPYLIDADYLPAGMTLSQAVVAVNAALAAWTNATSVKYKFAGYQSFGVPAPNVSVSDGVLRIQLHDAYHYTSGGTELGIGGGAWLIQTNLTGWTSGGNVAGNDFYLTARGYIVLQHTNAFMQNLANFAEVLCHEVGHTIGLGHSSENLSEPNSFLKQAIMYYLAHGSSRGATLNGWDTNVSRQVHPLNTPPWTYDRVMDIVSSPSPITTPGVNTVTVRGYDLQSTSLTFATTEATANNGSFSIVNSNITFTMNGWYADSGRLDPAGTSYRNIIYARYSDGTNASPFAKVRVLSYWSDSYNEGIPDAWRLAFFGSSNPNTGSNRHALQDYDGDGVNNVTEFWMGSNPTNRNSNLRVSFVGGTNLQWQAKGYELYEIQSSTNLVNWKLARSSIIPTNFGSGTDLFNLTNSVGNAAVVPNGAKQYYRVYRVP